ncbi:hypothetical protein [Flavobacterium sp.]|jgi:hypothetical protein|uniref:hypothetical protein n=1 Tax=Flavobacterium sp. TaxID=239 RepID=UPI0037BFEF4E
MTTKYLFLALASFSLLVVSCKKEEAAAATETQTNATESTTVAPKVATTPAETKPTGEKPALNPAHGEPFHRCDIAVGAPLDGPATQQSDSPVKQSAGPKSFFKTVQSESAANTATQPAQPTPQATPQATTTITPSAQAKPTPQATTTANTPKPKNNPAHGQPHHRCDIAVGAPLPDA